MKKDRDEDDFDFGPEENIFDRIRTHRVGAWLPTIIMGVGVLLNIILLIMRLLPR